MKFFITLQQLINKTGNAGFIALLLIRIFLAPTLIIAGWGKLANISGQAGYFESLGIPFPTVSVVLAGVAEFVGGIAITIGLATRWFAFPLMITMIAAAVFGHWHNGWHVLPETYAQAPWEWRKDIIEGAVERRAKAREILEKHGNTDYLYKHGNITILKGGIEFAATYFIMIMVLFCYGAGRYTSIDYWIARKFMPEEAT